MMQEWPGQKVGGTQPVQPTAQQPAQRPAPRGPVYGPAPAPAAQQAEIRAQEDQRLERERFRQQQANQANNEAIQRENLRLRQEAEARAAEKQQRESQRAEKGFDATEGERKAGAFLIRALGANEAFERSGQGARSLPQQALRDAFPSFENYFVSGERQVADSAQDEFIAASLRQDSGAAIPEEELERQRRIYFPMPGDGPEAIEQKRQARLRAIAGLEQSSGRLRESSMEEWERMREQLFGPQETDGARGGEAIQMRDGKPAFNPTTPGPGAQYETGFDKFDREASQSWVDRKVQEQLAQEGFTRSNLSRLAGTVNARSGDKSFTADDMIRAYRDSGIVAPLSREMAEPMAEAVRQGRQFNPSVNSQPIRQKYEAIIAEEAAARNELDGEPGYSDLAKSGVTLGLSDEASGVGNVIGKALTGDFNFRDNFAIGQAAELARRDQAREATGGLGTATELLGAGGSVRAVNALSNAMSIGRSIQASGRPVTRNALQSGLTRQAAKDGAVVGAVAGAAEGDSLAERGTNALIGGSFGAVLGAGGQVVGNRISNRGREAAPPASGNPTGAQAMQAADNLGIEVTPAVTGGRLTQAATAASRQSLVADLPIESSVSRMQGQAQAARETAAGKAGQVLDNEDAGNLVRKGAEIYSKRTSQIGSNLYARAHKRAGDVELPMTGAVKAIDDELATLAKSAQGKDSALYKDLSKLRDQMNSRSFDVEGIGATKTDLRNEITMRGLRGSPQDRIYMKVLDAAENDLIAGLQAAGRPEAAQALKTAREFWKRRVETIDQVLDPILGKNTQRSGEQIVSALERLGNPKTGDASKLRRLMSALPDDEASAVRATVINRLGRPTAGSSEDQAGFSFNTFLTNWNNLSPRARATMFPKESVDILNDLATISQRVKQAGNLENTSNTGRAVTALGQVSWFAVEPFTAGGAMAGQYAIGKLLASPRFARLLAKAPKQNTPQAKAAFDKRLSNLAVAEPTLAREIGLYQRAINDNTASRLAAEEEQPEGN